MSSPARRSTRSESHRDSSTRASPKPAPSESEHSQRSGRRRHSPERSDHSNRPDQSVQSYSVRELADSSEVSSRGKDDRGHHGRRGGHSDDEGSYSGDQYSSDYESEESVSRSGSRSYDSRSYDDRTQTHTSASYDDSERQSDRYGGDISAWGRKRVNLNNKDSESDYTMSSGLSPRGKEEEERAEFDVEDGKRALAYQAGMYARAQAMRRDGTAPKALGIADGLPDRMALQQLNALAGMADKVKKAIDHNRQVFKHRVKMEDDALLKKAFDAWRAARFGSIAKQQLLRRAIARLSRGLLSRAFFAWKDKFHLVDKYLAMRRKVAATINRGRKKRCFLEWWQLCVERRWKNQLALANEALVSLQKKVDGFEKRPITVIRRRRLYAMMEAWFNLSYERRKKRLRREKAVMHWKNIAYLKAWNSWREYTLECLRRRALIKKTALKIKNIHLVSAWNKWWEAVEERRNEEGKMNKAMRKWLNSTLSRAWAKWWERVERRRYLKSVCERWKNPHKARALRGWREAAAWKRRMRVILDRAIHKMKNRALYMAWEAWWQAIEDRKLEEQLTTKEQLVVAVKELREENERLRRDNERFVRLIDSGEWGRGRVAELVSAGEILKGERDALFKLIQSLRREYEAVQSAKVAQEEEMRALKERMMLGGAARNRMLIKGGSSFNAAGRAVKQDLVDQLQGNNRGTDPNLLYQVDQLSLNQVTIFADGELNVQAVAAAPGSAAFSKPVSASHGLRPPVSPVHPMRVPPGLPGASPGRSPLAVGAVSPGSGRPVSREEVVARLQGLSKEELDSFEAALRAQKAAQQQAAAARGGRVDAAGRPPGVASSVPGSR